MVIYPGAFLLFSAIIYPIMAEVLSQSFVIRLKEMEQLIQNLKQVVEDQQRMLRTFKSGKIYTMLSYLTGHILTKRKYITKKK